MEIYFIMTELHQSSSHFQVIDANPTKRIINELLKKLKRMQGVLYVQIVLFKLLDSLVFQGLCF